MGCCSNGRAQLILFDLADAMTLHTPGTGTASSPIVLLSDSEQEADNVWSDSDHSTMWM